MVEVAMGHPAVGIEPIKSTIFIQSQIPELAEPSMTLMNLVTVARLERNPTMSGEVRVRRFARDIPAGFLVTRQSGGFNRHLDDGELPPTKMVDSCHRHCGARGTTAAHQCREEAR